MKYTIGLFALGLSVLLNPAPAFAARPCPELTSLAMPDTSITAATEVAAGPFVIPGAQGRGGAVPPQPPKVAAFCRVQMTVKPEIAIEVWLPAAGWNGRFQGLGNGGYAGSISYQGLVAAVNAGYAAASTDTGHKADIQDWALNRPDLIADFGHRAIHEMTVRARTLMDAYYGMPPRTAIFSSCSNGGRQGLAEAQRYPNDYDGIIAGAPAVNWTALMMSGAAIGASTLVDPARYIPASKLPAINDASLKACDMSDGVSDGLVADPRKCSFDPAVLACKAGDSSECLTPGQVDALKQIYSGMSDPAGILSFPGRPPGVERGWAAYISGQPPARGGIINLGVTYMRYFIANDPTWDVARWNASRDLAAAAKSDVRSVLDHGSADLSAFRKRGGKLLMYHGWGDDAIPAENSINYFKKVVAATNGVSDVNPYAREDARFAADAARTGEFARLFMVPGMNHCFGGPGPTTFNTLDTMAAWIEQGTAPDSIIGRHLTDGVPDLTRPLCPFPQQAVYSGHGDVRDAANFSCQPPRTTP